MCERRLFDRMVLLTRTSGSFCIDTQDTTHAKYTSYAWRVDEDDTASACVRSSIYQAAARDSRSPVEPLPSFLNGNAASHVQQKLFGYVTSAIRWKPIVAGILVV